MAGIEGWGVFKGLAWAVAISLAVVVANAAWRYFADKRSDAAVVVAVEKNMDKLREDGARQSPDLLPSEAMRQEAKAKMEARLAEQAANKKKQAQVAADQFLGFLYVNTRTRVDYCHGLGVNIAAFKSAFERAHSDEIARAAAIYWQQGRDLPKEGDRLYGLLEEQLRKVIESDMRDAARRLNTDAPGACRAMSDSADEIVEKMRLRKANPALHQALMSH